MKVPLIAYGALVAIVCSACTSMPTAPAPTKGLPAAPEVYDSVYQVVDRVTRAPAGYGLYSMLLSRTADHRSLRALSELFATTGGAAEAAIEPKNLNLIAIPVVDANGATRALEGARNAADPAATVVMTRFYDFNEAARVMASICRPERGVAVMKACGSPAPDGPLLVTAQHPFTGSLAPGERLLIVNISTVSPEAIREVFAVYRNQITEHDPYDSSDRLDGWRLRALGYILDAAKLLPGISKAYADGATRTR